MNKVKAGWIGYIRSEQEFWVRAGQLAQLGYRGVEAPERFLMVGDIDDNMKRLHEMGLRVLCTYASLDAVRAHELKDIVRTAQLMQTDRVACYTSAVNGDFWNCPPTYDRVRRDIEQLEQLARELEEEGITLTYHNHAQDFQVRFRGQTCFDWMLSETEKLKILLDVGWAHYAGVDPCLLIRQIGNRVAALHVNDYRLKPDGTSCSPVFTAVGCGTVPLNEVLQTAAQVGVEWAVAEQDEMDHLPPVQALTAAYLNMKETGFVQ